MSTPQFTPQEADELIAVAQSAPLMNLRHAERVSILLSRFKAWYEHVTNSEESRPARRSCKANATPPDPQDPTS